MLASIYTKHPRDDSDPFMQRAPAKRVAVNPQGNHPFVPNRKPPVPHPPAAPNSSTRQGPTATLGADQATTAAHGGRSTDPALFDNNRRMPRQRVPVSTRPEVAAAGGVSAPTVGNTVKTATMRSGSVDAATVADMKGREFAAAICKSIKLDGYKEGTVVPHAVLTCLARHLVGDKRLVELGRDMARKVDSLVRNMSPQSKQMPVNNSLLNLASPTVADQVTHAAAGQVVELNKVSTCKVTATINGQEVEAVLDSGVSTSAISLDCLRRLGMDGLIQTGSGSTCVNADGRMTKGRGKVPNLVLGLGGFQTLINPTVTNSLGYSLLIGNEALSRAHVVLDYGKRKLLVQIDPELQQELDISITTYNDPPGALCLEEMLTSDTCSESCDDVAVEIIFVDQTGSSFTFRTKAPRAYQEGLVALWDEYLNTVYSLPPQPALEPGRKRNTAGDDHQAESVLNEDWLAMRHKKIAGLESELVSKYFHPHNERLLSLLRQMEKMVWLPCNGKTIRVSTRRYSDWKARMIMMKVTAQCPL